MSKIRAEFYNNLIDRILDSKLETEKANTLKQRG